jgi:hypothetical protein
VTEKVEVSASADLINYTSPEIGHVVGEEQLMNIPLVATNSRGRATVLLSKLVPGVTSTSANNSNINNFSFGGGRPVTNEILVDGLPTTNPSDQTYTLTPSPESIQEFKVITTPFSAEFGHTGGGVMILTSKSGSNVLHGFVADYFRNRILNAAPVFGSANPLKYVQNDPGATIGGPVVLPKVYDGRNKTFFFFDFNVTLASNGNLYQQLVPTADQKRGDFSKTFANGKLVTIYDPATTTKNADGTFSRMPFGSNLITSDKFNAVSAKILSFYPDPMPRSRTGSTIRCSRRRAGKPGNPSFAWIRISATPTKPSSASAATIRTAISRRASPTSRTTTRPAVFATRRRSSARRTFSRRAW